MQYSYWRFGLLLIGRLHAWVIAFFIACLYFGVLLKPWTELKGVVRFFITPLLSLSFVVVSGLETFFSKALSIAFYSPSDQDLLYYIFFLFPGIKRAAYEVFSFSMNDLVFRILLLLSPGRLLMLKSASASWILFFESSSWLSICDKSSFKLIFFGGFFTSTLVIVF